MPKPLFKNNNIVDIINSNVEILKKIDEEIIFKCNFNNHKDLIIYCDYEQISRTLFNLIKNSIESIKEKALKSNNIAKIIHIEIINNSDYITINITDSGIGFSNKTTKDLIKPYYTTKEKGSGLGLSIVDKIINDHNGSINFNTIKQGAKVEINLPKNN